VTDILVTGAGGFVGAHVARRLAAEGHNVTATVRPGVDPWRLAGATGALKVLPLDLEDGEALAAAVAGARPEWVLHMAAHGAYSWQTDRDRILSTNLRATAVLLDAAIEHGCAAFVHAGSSSEYGLKDHPTRESDVPEPNSDYAVMKAAATMHCAYVARARDVHAVTLRLYSVYGPWEEPNRLVPKLLAHGLDGTLPPLVAPETARDFVHVDDVYDAFVAAATRQDLPRGSIFNVGSGRQTTLGEIVETARALLGVEAEPEWGSHAARSWDTSIWVSDPSLAAERLGWAARRGLREGLSATIDWLLGAPGVWERYGVSESGARAPRPGR
jgi:dolichol-phosphate mannosyltransferase